MKTSRRILGNLSFMILCTFLLSFSLPKIAYAMGEGATEPAPQEVTAQPPAEEPVVPTQSDPQSPVGETAVVPESPLPTETTPSEGIVPAEGAVPPADEPVVPTEVVDTLAAEPVVQTEVAVTPTDQSAVPTDEAVVIEEPAQPAPELQAVVEEPAAPAQSDSTAPDAETAVVAESPVSTETPAPDAVVEEPQTPAEVMQALPEDINLVVVNENGDTLSLASAEASEVFTAPDPYYVFGTVTYRFMTDCSSYPDSATSDCEVSVTPIQTAIDSITADQYPTDGKLYVEAGTYDESVNINGKIPTKFTGLVGTGTPTIKSLTVINMVNFLVNGFVFTDFIYMANNSGNVTLENISITNSAIDKSINIDETGGDVSLNNVSVQDTHTGHENNSIGTGISINNTTGNVLISDTHSDNNGPNWTDGNIQFQGGRGLEIITTSGNINIYGAVDESKSTFDNNSKEGIYIENVNGSVTLDTISASSNCYSVITDFGGVTVKNNGLSYAEGSGNTLSAITILDSILNLNRSAGLWLDTVGAVTLGGVEGVEGVEVNQNNFDNSGGRFNQIHDATSVTIEGSHFDNNGRYDLLDPLGWTTPSIGLKINWGSYDDPTDTNVNIPGFVEISNSTFTDNTEGGLEVDGSTPTAVWDSYYEVWEWVWAGHDNSVTLTDVTLNNPSDVSYYGSTGLFLTGVGDVMLKHVHADQYGFGASFYEVGDVTITSNTDGENSTFDGNLDAGLEILHAGDVNITGISVSGNGWDKPEDSNSNLIFDAKDVNITNSHFDDNGDVTNGYYGNGLVVEWGGISYSEDDQEWDLYNYWWANGYDASNTPGVFTVTGSSFSGNYGYGLVYNGLYYDKNYYGVGDGEWVYDQGLTDEESGDPLVMVNISESEMSNNVSAGEGWYYDEDLRGLDIQYASSVVLAGLTLDANSWDNIGVGYTDSVKISDTVTTNSYADGIYLYDVGVTELSGITATGNGWGYGEGFEYGAEGLYIESGWGDLTITDSTFNYNASYGIYIDGLVGDIKIGDDVNKVTTSYNGVYLNGVNSDNGDYMNSGWYYDDYDGAWYFDNIAANWEYDDEEALWMHYDEVVDEWSYLYNNTDASGIYMYGDDYDLEGNVSIINTTANYNMGDGIAMEYLDAPSIYAEYDEWIGYADVTVLIDGVTANYNGAGLVKGYNAYDDEYYYDYYQGDGISVYEVVANVSIKDTDTSNNTGNGLGIWYVSGYEIHSDELQDTDGYYVEIGESEVSLSISNVHANNNGGGYIEATDEYYASNGIYISDIHGDVSINNNTTASGNSGIGIQMEDVHGYSIYSNETLDEYGYALYLGNAEVTVSISDVTANNNVYNGAVFENIEANVNITDSSFDSNGDRKGSGLYIYDVEGNIDISESFFDGNAYTGLYIEEVHGEDGGNVALTNIQANDAEYYGVELYNIYGTTTITCSTFDDNTEYGIYGNNFYGDVTLVGGPYDYDLHEFDGCELVELTGDCGLEKCEPQETQEIEKFAPTGIEMNVDGSQVVPLDCAYNWQTLVLPTQDRARFASLCGSDAQFNPMGSGSLPGALPEGYTFGGSFNASLMQNGTVQSIFPAGGNVKLSFVVPAELLGKNLVLMMWDAAAGAWVEIPVFGTEGSFSASNLAMQVLAGMTISSDGVVTATVNFSGTFVLVGK